MKFSQANVRKLAAPAGKADITIWDDALPGFGIRFRNGGGGVFVIQYFVNGAQAKLGLGKVAQVALDDAQAEARQHFATVAKKVDPRVARAQTMAKAKSGGSLAGFIPGYLSHLETKGRVGSYLDENRRSLGGVNDRRGNPVKGYFCDLHRFNLDDVTRAMVAEELEEMVADRGPIAMTRSRAHLHAFWAWAISSGYCEHGNPVAGTLKYDSARRDRQHSERELMLIWKASNQANDYDVIQQLIMLTGARRNQIGQLKRREVKHNEGHIKLQGPGRSKNGTTFLLPISTQAIRLLNTVWDRRQDDSGYLFGECGGEGFSGWSQSAARFKDRLDDEVDDYWLHDYRRTFQNIGQTKLKIPLHVTEACMNHISGEANKGAKKHYNFAEYYDEKVEAMQRWGDFVETTVGKSRSRLAA